MNPAHLGLLLAALPKERPAWKTTLEYLAEHAVQDTGVFFGSIRSLKRGAPGRVPLKLGEEKIKESFQALQNLLLARLVPSVDGTGLTNQISLLPGMTTGRAEELAFALSRPAAWQDRRAARRLWACLERRRSSESLHWADLGPRFLGEQMDRKHLLSDEFLCLPRQEAFAYGTPLSKVDPGVGSILELGPKVDPGVGCDLGNLDPTSGSNRDPLSGFGTLFAASGCVKASLPQPIGDGLVVASGRVETRGDNLVHETNEQAALRRTAAAQTKLNAAKASGSLKAASKTGPLPDAAQRKESRSKSTTTREQILRQWTAWAPLKPLLEMYYGEGCIVTVAPPEERQDRPTGQMTLDKAPAIQEQLRAQDEARDLVLVEMHRDIDLKASNPEALAVLKALAKTKSFLFGQAAVHAPRDAMKAWIAYAKLFRIQYQGKSSGDQRGAAFLSILVNRLVGKHRRVSAEEILPRMGGFVWRMDLLRRNSKTQFYPNPEWSAIYDATDRKSLTAWHDATSAGNKDPFVYMLSVEPFTADLTPEPEEKVKTPAERLAELRATMAEQEPYAKQRYELTNIGRSWDKLPEDVRISKLLVPQQIQELKDLIQEVEGDPSVQAVRPKAE